jgi:hypothetical protein
MALKTRMGTIGGWRQTQWQYWNGKAVGDGHLDEIGHWMDGKMRKRSAPKFEGGI